LKGISNKTEEEEPDWIDLVQDREVAGSCGPSGFIKCGEVTDKLRDC
jgi:hypothetical protein